MSKKKKTVVIDVDDVFWPLNEHAAKIACIDYGEIATFIAKQNPFLNPDEQQRLHDAYKTPRIHADMDFYPGAEEFGILARDPRIDPWICSNSLDQSVIDDKIRNLRQLLGSDYDLFQTMYHIISMERSGEKKFPDGVHILVDDSPLNAIASKARHVVMPRRPWNQSEWGLHVLSPIVERVRWYDRPMEACAIIRSILDWDGG